MCINQAYPIYGYRGIREGQGFLELVQISFVFE